MERLTYKDLVARYGAVMASDLLLTIEKTAHIRRSEDYLADEETRLQKALEALDRINFAA
jgi:hypothetical protein